MAKASRKTSSTFSCTDFVANNPATTSLLLISPRIFKSPCTSQRSGPVMLSTFYTLIPSRAQSFMVQSAWQKSVEIFSVNCCRLFFLESLLGECFRSRRSSSKQERETLKAEGRKVDFSRCASKQKGTAKG